MKHDTHNAAPAASAPPDLRKRVFDRVRMSLAHERQFHTVRRDADAWHSLQPGVRIKALARTAVGRSTLVELAPNATLVPTPGFTQLELVLLEGETFVGSEAIGCGDAVLAPHDGKHRVSAGPSGARLFLRLSTPDEAPSKLLRFSTLVDDKSWDDFRPGVRFKALWGDGERSSLLVRMRAGASVSQHGHPLEEECMMLAGEAFVGDTLLRSGEYQLAPSGSRHGEVMTDVGALFFVHGSLDPSAYD